MTTDLGFDSAASALALQHGSKVVVAGSSFPGTVVLARYTEAGPRDMGFDEDGQTRTNVGRKGGGARDVAVLPDGRILAAGYGIDEQHNWTAVLLAYHPDGRPDTSFSSDGIVRVTPEQEGAEIEFEALQVLPSGKILLAGDLGGYLMAIRLLPNGKPDPSFNGDGQAYLGLGTPDCSCAAYATGLAIDRRGRAVISANVTGTNPEPAALVRYLPNGRLDRSFGTKGVVRSALGNRLAGHDVAIQHNGKIVVAGTYNVPKTGEARVAVLRYLPDGRLDRSFARKGFFTRDFGVEGVAYSVLVQRDGRVVVGGRANPDPSPFPENESVFDTAEVFLMRFLP